MKWHNWSLITQFRLISCTMPVVLVPRVYLQDIGSLEAEDWGLGIAFLGRVKDHPTETTRIFPVVPADNQA